VIKKKIKKKKILCLGYGEFQSCTSINRHHKFDKRMCEVPESRTKSKSVK